MAKFTRSDLYDAAEKIQRSFFDEPEVELPAGWELVDEEPRVAFSHEWFWFPWMAAPGKVAIGGRTPAKCWVVRKVARSRSGKG